VAAREHAVKSSSFLNKASWVKHVADLSKHERATYLHKLPSRLAKIVNFLEYIMHFNNTEDCNSFVDNLQPAIVIVDPKLNPHINYPRKITEDRVKRRHEKLLALLADNIAYYAYWVTEIKKRPQELGKVVKK
jgi:hypothetical protein